MPTLDRYQVRSQKTLKRLLDAAEEVFVRDGFESAQMDQIAARAERSKGAVYVHFKSKEDLFLALIEHRIRSYIDLYLSRMKKCTTVEQRFVAFREFYAGLIEDKDYHVLSIEFKLFALRHPEWKERYNKALKALKMPNDDGTYEQMFGKIPRTAKAELEASLAALGPIVNSLVLERYFEPATLSDKALQKVLNRIFDALIPHS